MAIIRTEGLSKVFRTGFTMKKVEAVKGVDLKVDAGEIYGFIGPNGAGKTSTIKMLTGLILPTAGEAWIQDIPVSDPKCRAHLGFLPEGTFFHEYLTGREFLDFHGQLLGIDKATRQKRAGELLERVGIPHAGDMRIRSYSKGMRQRVGLAQALIADPEVVILDEPMSGLDPLGRKDVRDLILSLRDEGKTVFFSSHILGDAEVICDQVAIIVNGNIVHQGYIDDLLGQEVSGVELVLEGIDAPLFEELKVGATRAITQGPRFLLEFEDEASAQRVLERTLEAKGHVRSLVPRRRSLEDLFVEEAKKGNYA